MLRIAIGVYNLQDSTAFNLSHVQSFGKPMAIVEIRSYGTFAGTICTDQLLFCAALKKAVLKKHRPDSGSETHEVAIHCSVTPTLGPAKVP
jgi:hypothetical protein